MLSKFALVTDQTLAIAKIIFMRIRSQISGQRIDNARWLAGLAGYKTDPELFPVVEACVDAAMKIERVGFTENRPD